MRRIERGRQKKKKDYRWYNGSWRTGINRYIMECKCIYQFACVAPQWELIDTLWNVNKVETLSKIAGARINRYIMECKYVCCDLFICASIELIDTLWNVNAFRWCRAFWRSRINRYIMECKSPFYCSRLFLRK